MIEQYLLLLFMSSYVITNNIALHKYIHFPFGTISPCSLIDSMSKIEYSIRIQIGSDVTIAIAIGRVVVAFYSRRVDVLEG